MAGADRRVVCGRMYPCKLCCVRLLGQVAFFQGRHCDGAGLLVLTVVRAACRGRQADDPGGSSAVVHFSCFRDSGEACKVGGAACSVRKGLENGSFENLAT